MTVYNNPQQQQQEDGKDFVKSLAFFLLVLVFLAFATGCGTVASLVPNKLDDHVDACFLAGGTPDYSVNGSYRKFACRMASK